MSVNSTSLSTRMQSGIDIINNTETQKFPLILNRIVQCIQNKTDIIKPFSEEEEDKLSTALSISQPDLKLMLDCSTFILQETAFNIIKPALLQQHLSQHYKLQDEKVDAFVSVWSNQAKNIVGSLKQKSLYPKQMEGVGWLLNTAVSSSESGLMLQPQAVLELKLRHTDKESGNLTLNLNQADLQVLYETLENVQTQLDSLR